MNIKNTQLYTYMQGVFVVVFQVVIFLTTFFVPATILAQEKQPSKELQSEKIEIVSEEKVDKEITPVLEESKPVEAELSREQLQQIAELDELLNAEKITQEEYDKQKAEIIGIKPVEEESLLASRSSSQIEPEAQTLGKYIAPEISESNGSLNYSYPIVVPEGRNGLTPKINLNYSSANKSKSSVIGTGWAFDIPYIQRNNKRGTDKLYTEDYFISSLDGELIDQGNGIYTPRTENGSFLKYEYINDTWKITDKTGTTYEFGATAQARQDDPNDSTRIFSWMLETVTDTNSNTIDYNYFKDQGQIYPDSISYNQSGLFGINFKRGLTTNAYTLNSSGFNVTTSQYINEVEIKTDGVVSARYDITVTNNHVKNITITGVEGGNSFVLPPTEFEYEFEGISSNSLDNYTPSFDQSFNRSATYRTADINGDSLVDFIDYPSSSSSPYVYINDGTTWNYDNTWQFPTGRPFGYQNTRYNRNLIDINGDGLSDFVDGQQNRRLKVFINNGDKTFSYNPSYERPFYRLATYRLADINADGLVDLVDYYSTNPTVYINNGNGWDYDSTWQFPSGKPFGYNSTRYNRELIDINGDGLADFVDGQVNKTLKFYINNGDKTFTYNSSYDRSFYRNSTYRLADLNGDGLTDFADYYSTNPFVFINNGNGWTYNTTWQFPYGKRFGYNNTRYNRDLMDIDGDGLADFIDWQLNNEMLVYLNGSAGINLSKLTNSEEGTVVFTYINPSVQDSSNTAPLSIQAVASMATNDNNGNVATTSYEYRDASYYFNTSYDKKFAGFGSVIKTNPDGSVETTKYHQANGEIGNEPTDSYAKIGKVYEKTIEDTSGNLFTRNRTNYTETSLGNNAYSIQTTSELTQQYDGTSSHTDTAMGYVYDSYGNIDTLTQYGEVNGNADGTFTDTGSDKRTVDYSYTANTGDYIVGLPTNETLKDNGGSKVAETNYSYDANGNLLTESQWISGSDYADIVYTYNSYGLPLTETDALNKVTTFSYDVHNLYPSSVTNAENHVMSYTYDYSSGKPTSVTESNGKVTEYEYDGLDRLVDIKQTFENGSPLTTKAISYNTTASPQYTKETLYRSASDTQDIYTYTDGFGKTIQTKSEMDSNWLTLDTVYNDMGRVEKQSLPYETSSSTYSSPTNTNNLLTSFVYDALGRVLSTTNAKGTTATSYNGFETSITDAENNQKDLITDAFGNLIQVNEYNNGSVYETEYEYNTLNLLTKITDEENNERAISYDGLGRRTQLEDLHASSDGTYGVWNFTYNDINLASQTDPNGTITSYTYDDIHRVLTENNSSTAGTDITYTYDSCSYGTGQLCSVTTPDITTNYTYLKQGLVDTESKAIDGVTYITDTDYDRQGNITKETHPNNSYTEYEYNTRGLVDKVEYNGTSLVTADYGVHGRPTSYVHNNGINSTLSYDANELYELTNKTTTDGITDLQNLSYSYDNVGNITQIVDSSDTDTSKTQIFTYDDLYRLAGTTVTGSANSADYSRSYSYSPIGNITAFDGVNYLYTDTGYSNPHAVTNIGGVSYTYDNNGNLTNDGTWTHTWDYRNRLVSSTDGTTTSSYEYDHENMRTKLVEGSDTTIYPSASYEVLNGDAKVSMSLGETLVATDNNGTINHVHTDHLGGTNITTDTTGVITQTLDYFPYGDTRIDTGTDNETKQFTGYVKDASTGLQYAGARYYTGNTGRFISQDPAYLKIGLPEFEKDYNRTLTQHLANPQALNSYTYALNNPVVLDDENGEIAPLTLIGYGLTALGIIDLAFNAVEADLMAQYPEQFSIDEMDKLRDETIFKAATGVFGTALKGPEAILYDAGLIALEELAPYVENSNNDIEKNIDTGFSPSSDVLQYQIINNNFDNLLNKPQNQTDPLQETASFVKETFNNLHNRESKTTGETQINRTNEVRKKRDAI